MPFPLDHYIEASMWITRNALKRKKAAQLAEIRFGICQYRGRTLDFWRKE